MNLKPPSATWDLLRHGAAFALLLLLAAPALAQATTRPLNEQAAPTAPTNTAFTLTRGWEFNVTQPGGVTVMELGCLVPDGSTASQTLSLWERQTTPTAAWILLAQTTTTPGSGWLWEPITPVQLQTGVQYAVTVFGYSLYGWASGAPTSWRPTGVITYTNGLWRNQAPTALDPVWTSNSSIQATGHQGFADIGYVIGPGLTVTPEAGTPVDVLSTEQGPGGNGVQAGKFTMGTNPQGAMSVTTLDLKASGSGDDSLAFTEVSIYLDDGNGSYDAADVAVSPPGNFTADDGIIPFTIDTQYQHFNANETKTYLVVVKMAGTALPGETFSFSVSDVTVSGGLKSVAATIMSGLVIETPQFLFADVSAATPATAYLGSTGNVCQAFTIDYPGGPDDKPDDITVTGLGTADESTDLVNVELWWDADTSGDFDAQNDTLIDTQTYSQDDGTATFSLSSHTDFVAGQSRRYFVVYNLNTNASGQETFQCFVSAATPSALGATMSGLPAPGLSGTAGLEVGAVAILVTLNGPGGPIAVNANTTGPTGDGAVLCDVTLEATAGASWTVSGLTFHADGTGSHDSAYLELALYEDDGNDTFDGQGTDTLAAGTLTDFSAGVASFTLNNPAFAAGTTRRFFLTGKLDGTPLSGETFNALLHSVDTTPPTGGVITGTPTAASQALIIDVAGLSVSNAPSQPPAITHAAGATGSYLAARFRLAALNNSVDVFGVTLTAGGSGDWTNDVDPLAGVQVYEDDGDGVFSDTLDALMFEGGGSGVITAGFLSAITVPAAGSRDIWVRIGFTATAGAGAVAVPDTFVVSIAATVDVNSSANVVLGSPVPVGVTVGAIDFGVTSFVPGTDLQAGGKPITITGSGFVSPFTVKIGGVTCPGTATISGGTQVTGLSIPAGTGQNLPIEISSGNMPARVIAQTFTYSKVGSTTGGGGGGGGGCMASGGAAPLVALLALAGWARRRRR